MRTPGARIAAMNVAAQVTVLDHLQFRHGIPHSVSDEGGMRNDETRFFMVPQSSFILDDFITRNRLLRQPQPRTGQDREAVESASKAQERKDKLEIEDREKASVVSYDPP